MPELPEVENVRKQLAPSFVSRTIQEIWAGPNSYFFITPPRQLKRELPGKKVRALARHGKYLVATLSDDSQLLLHLGMTGQLTTQVQEQDRHLHLIFKMSRGKTIYFRDVRKFGKVEWIAPGESSTRLEKLGPDALELEGEALYRASRNRKIPVKTLLLDQKVSAGIGNIYADEALFRAGIRPSRPSSRLTKSEAIKLAREVRQILALAVSAGGSSINDYMQPNGNEGDFQHLHKIYGKTGETCSECEAKIQRVVLGGRSSHFCRRCQK
ncbi:MAG: bifunctional DNA-formamidopyrimidine glycosylase/DNA-(apurinic or apyrimidinic site) lyase [Polyangiaceae bacterium]|nr:bifunctional DNA-formamidopyrimidine glycosylase/DNA-(apurinic or apyrimidinic site) lyase [Polyangiaceae bacterium]